VLANDSLSAACFLELGADEKVPDHSTLTLFKERFLENGRGKAYEDLFDEIIRIAQENGYKDQVSLNAETEIITSVKPGYGDEYDGRWFPYLVERDLKKGIEIETVAGDRGYDDGENHYFLEQKGVNSAIRLKDFRTQKKDSNKEGWLKLKGSKGYQEGLKQRYKIERKFGEMKKWHGFGRCRYLGLARHAIQLFLTSIAVNLKRMVKLLAGISFRGEVKSYLKAG